MRVVLAVTLCLLTGCNIYFGGDDTGDDDCLYGGAQPPYAPYQVINPDTLACESWGGWGGCDGVCGPCDQGDRAPLPSWGLCDSTCRVLDENSCLDASGCRATYDWACYTGERPCTALTDFTGCYPTDMNGPIQGACTGLDAWACSQHDDCIALHDSALTDGWSTFVECRDETPSCGVWTTEQACVGAGEPCIPAYTGTDCTCNPQGACDCQTWTFRECIEQR